MVFEPGRQSQWNFQTGFAYYDDWYMQWLGV